MTRRDCTLALLAAVAACGEPAGPVRVGVGVPVEYQTHREVDVGFQGVDGAILSGTLILPKAQGLYPVMVLHFGASAWERTTYVAERFWVNNGFAVFTYDKRGVGRSQGECCPFQTPGYFQLHGSDVVAAVRAILPHAEIDARGVGLFGSGHGGWVIPVAAAQLEDTVAFAYVASGTAVSLGETLLYRSLTGANECRRSGTSFADIDRAVAEAGPSMFDPGPYLESMTAPSLWLFGANDLTSPVQRSVEALERLQIQQAKDFTFVVLQRMNENFVLDGEMCESSGPGGIDPEIVVDWVKPRLAARGITAVFPPQ